MRVKKDGFVLYLEGTWMEISNKYGVLEYWDVAVDPEDAPEGYAEKALDAFIRSHSVLGNDVHMCIKRVAFDRASGKYIQLQAVLSADGKCWEIQEYDDELVYMGVGFPIGRNYDEALQWMQDHYDIAFCLSAYVFRSSLGDCTNGGISASGDTLYILSEKKGVYEPKDIRECVCVERHEVIGEPYISCRPAYCSRRWYMAGGNFLYTSDNRFREITGSRYPIPIHDRYEER